MKRSRCCRSNNSNDHAEERHSPSAFAVRQHCRRRYSGALFLLLCTSSTATVSAFSMHMEYKPPVKSSVKKLYDQRFPRQDESSSSSRKNNHNNNGKRRSFAKAAFAGALTAPPPSSPPTIPVVPESFERRMRDLVLGGQDLVRRRNQQRTQLPDNVLTIETLQEYKRVVADETEKIVAVRFYAPWCKVRSLA